MKARAIGAAVAVLVLGLMLLDASWRSDDEPLAATNGREAFDAAAVRQGELRAQGRRRSWRSARWS